MSVISIESLAWSVCMKVILASKYRNTKMMFILYRCPNLNAFHPVLQTCSCTFNPSLHPATFHYKHYLYSNHRNVFGLSWVVIHNLWFHTLSALDQIYFPHPMAAILIDNFFLGKSLPLNQSLTAGLGPVLLPMDSSGRNSGILTKVSFFVI